MHFCLIIRAGTALNIMRNWLRRDFPFVAQRDIVAMRGFTITDMKSDDSNTIETTQSGGDAPASPSEDAKHKTRLCLSCRSPFESTWSGERVCRRCKATSNWRGGR